MKNTIIYKFILSGLMIGKLSLKYFIHSPDEARGVGQNVGTLI